MIKNLLIVCCVIVCSVGCNLNDKYVIHEIIKVMLEEFNAKVDNQNGRHDSTELMIAAANQ